MIKNIIPGKRSVSGIDTGEDSHQWKRTTSCHLPIRIIEVALKILLGKENELVLSFQNYTGIQFGRI